MKKKGLADEIRKEAYSNQTNIALKRRILNFKFLLAIILCFVALGLWQDFFNINPGNDNNIKIGLNDFSLFLIAIMTGLFFPYEDNKDPRYETMFMIVLTGLFFAIVGYLVIGVILGFTVWLFSSNNSGQLENTIASFGYAGIIISIFCNFIYSLILAS